MFKITLLILCILVTYASFSQCTLSFEELESLAKENRQAFHARLTKASFNLEKDLDQNGVFRRNYFCTTSGERMQAIQLTAVGVNNLIKAVTYETSNNKQFKNVCSDFKQSGYQFVKSDENKLGDQLVKMDHYKKGNSEVITYNYEIDGYRIYCCGLQPAQ